MEEEELVSFYGRASKIRLKGFTAPCGNCVNPPSRTTAPIVCSDGNLLMYLHHDLRVVLLLLDDHMALGIRQPGSRQLRVFLDTDDAEAIAWGGNVYKRYREEVARMLKMITPAYHQAFEVLDSRIRTTA